MTVQRGEPISASHIPHSYCVIQTAKGQQPAVLAEANGGYRNIALVRRLPGRDVLVGLQITHVHLARHFDHSGHPRVLHPRVALACSNSLMSVA